MDRELKIPPRMSDVAELAGVSVKTVSNVLAERYPVKSDKRERVLEAVRVLGYRVNVSARNLRSGSTRVIGLGVPDLSQAYFGELSAAVIRSASEYGYTVLIEQTSVERATEDGAISGMQYNLVDGIIISPLATGIQGFTDHELDVPVVVLGERSADSRADHITMSNVASAHAATAHLLDTGRRRIAVIGAYPDDPRGTAARRYEGYCEALAAAEIDIDPELVVDVPLWHRADGIKGVERLLERGVTFDGIFCFNDALALGALHALLSRGLKVPEDVALVGFDNIEDAQYSFPALTTISPGRDEIARLAVKTIIDRIEGRLPPAVVVDEIVDFTLMVRESTSS